MTTTKRSPKFGANKSKPAKPLTYLLTKPQTLPVLAAVDRHELLTNSQLHDLFFRQTTKTEATTQRACSRLIRPLIDAGLLEAGMVWYEAESGFPYPYRYLQITTRGAAVLAEHGYEVRYKSTRKDKAQDSARHILGISEFYVALQRACWAVGATLPLWVDDRQLSGMERSQTLLENVPDAFFVIEHEGKHYPGFLEYDRGTEILVSGKGRTTDLATKYDRYGEHLKNRFHLAPYFEGLSAPVVLSLTTGGQVRLKGMMDTCHDAKGRASYWFATTKTLYQSSDPMHFWSKLWALKPTHDPEVVSYRSLLDRMQ